MTKDISAAMIGGALAAAREALGKTREEIASAAELPYIEIIDIEEGAGDPYLSSYQRYARALGIRIIIGVDGPDRQVTES